MLKILRVPPPSFCRFPDLEDGEADSIEFFTTDRVPQMTRHVFEEKIFPGLLWGFWKTFRFSSCPGKLLQILSDWPENCFAGTSSYGPEVVLSFSKNLAFFFFYERNTLKVLSHDGVSSFRVLPIWMERSKLKTADFTSGPTSKVSVVKISTRSDEVKGGLYVAQVRVLCEKPVLRKT